MANFDITVTLHQRSVALIKQLLGMSERFYATNCTGTGSKLRGPHQSPQSTARNLSAAGKIHDASHLQVLCAKQLQIAAKLFVAASPGLAEL
eukprot:s2055_g20.t1